jgi:RNA polymerase sigma factor (sigma-70 family)
VTGQAPEALGASSECFQVPAAELEQFYRFYFLPLVRRVVRKHGASFEDAADIVQDAFVIAISKLDSSRNPKAWLYQVVDHVATNWQRKKRRRAKLTAQWLSPQPSADPEESEG